MNTMKTKLTPRWCGELAHYFKTEDSTPEVINASLRHAAMVIARNCAHLETLEAEDLEQVADALGHLSDIMDIVDKYEEEDL